MVHHPAIHRVLRCVVPINQHEVPAVLHSFGALFVILFSYFLLLPLREDAGISLGTSTLPLLFACSLLVTLLVTPTVTVYLNSKGHAQGRDAALRHFYRVMAGILLGFFVLYNFSMVEAWMDTLNLSSHHLPTALPHDESSSSKAAAMHPLDALLHQRHQQQQQQLGQPQYKQQRQLVVRHMRHLLQDDDEQDSQVFAAEAADSIAISSAANGTASLISSSSSSGGGSSSSSESSSESSSHHHSSRSSTVSSRTGDAALSKQQRWLRGAFYIWVGVMNLVGISSLWAKCADTFDPQAAKRLFGFISAGATLGQLAGSLTAMAASWMAGAMLSKVQQAGGSVGSSSGSGDGGSIAAAAGGNGKAAPPASSLLLVAAVLQLIAAQLVTRIRPVAPSAAAGSAAAPSVVVAKVVTSDGVGAAVAEQDSGFNSSRPMSPQLTRRSSTGASRAHFAAVVASSSIHSSSSNAANGNGNSSSSHQQRRAVLSTIVQSQPSGGVQPGAAAAAASLVSTSQKHSVDGSPARQHNGAPGVAVACGDIAARVQEQPGGGGGSSKGAADSFQAQKVLTGFALIWRSRYLLLVCSNLLLTYVVGSLMYFQRALVVSAAAAVQGPTFRTAFFAALNTYSAAAILLMQLFATSSMLRVLGMTAALSLAPAICLTALFSVASCPLPYMVAVSEVLRKIFGYAVLRPAREVLFTVVSREEKYSAKLVIDTVIQRLGDALAAAVFQVLDVQYSLGQEGVAAAGCVACVLWMFTALALGRKHKQLASHGTALHV